MAEGCSTLHKGASQFAPSWGEAAAGGAGEQSVRQDGHRNTAEALPASL